MKTDRQAGTYIRLFIMLAATFVAALLISCSHAALIQGSAPSSPSAGFLPLAEPEVAQKGSGATWVTFTPHTFGALGAGIVAGPDGNMRYIDENAASLVRLSMGVDSKNSRCPATSEGTLSL